MGENSERLGRKEAEEVLLSLLREKKDTGQAVSLIERLVRVNDSTDPGTVENLLHLQELRSLYGRILSAISLHPDDWRERLSIGPGAAASDACGGGAHGDSGARGRTETRVFRKAFDGRTEKRDAGSEARKRPDREAPPAPAPAAAQEAAGVEAEPRPEQKEATTTFRKDFDGTTEKRVVEPDGETRVFKKERGGEFLPVSSEEDQLSDTAMLLKLVADEDFEAIERLGYKVKRRESGRAK